MRDVVEEFLGHLGALGRSWKTLVEYRRRLDAFADFASSRGARTVRALSVELVRAYHDSMLERG